MFPQRFSRGALLAALLSQLFQPLVASGGGIIHALKKHHPHTPIQKLAAAVDRLEREIDGYGSVTVKQPDVWGEARWTQHRQQYERVLGNELNSFKFTVNARISEADNAFLMNAMALGAAVQSGGGGAPSANVSQVFGEPFPQPSYITAPMVRAFSHKDPGTEVQGVAIEPTEFLDQLSRYVDHLNQLRRINEGDDTADAAGYALNLIRIPVSVLPGNETRTGYGAEVTVTLTPELSDDLLPMTFKDLVVNDLIDQLGLPLVKLAERLPPALLVETLEAERQRFCDLTKLLNEILPMITGKDSEATSKNSDYLAKVKRAGVMLESLVGPARNCDRGMIPEIARDQIALVREYMRCRLSVPLGGTAMLDLYISVFRNFDVQNDVFLSKMQGQIEDEGQKGILSSLRTSESNDTNRSVGQVFPADTVESTFTVSASTILDIVEQFNQLFLSALNDSQRLFTLSASQGSGLAAPRDRQARYAIPPTEIPHVFGVDQLTCIARDLDRIRQANGSQRLHLPDAHGFLAEELEAAYRFLMEIQEEGCDPWSMFCPGISKAVNRLRYGEQFAELGEIRGQFEKIAESTRNEKAVNGKTTGSGCTIRALAWAILVESALLNDHLMADMQRVQTATGVPFLPGYPLQFFGPQPDPVARQVFNEYVRWRWPIHVFAIDPVIQEQNVADAFARRRETQLALALAFTSGRMSAQNFSRFARQVDFELQTISLNRTVVGFSHGNDTFGWRMYPRVQAPPIEGNLKVCFRDLLIGAPSRDRDLRKRQLEPGPRELLAIVIMPGFVPTVRMDVRSNWFDLVHPDRKRFTTKDSVRLGEQIQYVRYCKAQCIAEDGLTRPGDSRRLLQAVDQLEKRLPLQDTIIQVPYENSVGGFQLFSEGTRNLGPELIGFYGEPGINTKADTDLFLVGRNFNVNVTRVVIGGKDCVFDLLSREVMRVRVPKDVQTFKVKEYVNGKTEDLVVVDAHVATPYGVSGHLHIPADVSGPAAGSPFSFNPATVSGCLAFQDCMANRITLQQPIELRGLKAGDSFDLAVRATAVLGDGNERALQIAGTPNPSAEFKMMTSGASNLRIDFTNALNTFLNGPQRLLQHERPLALKVSVTVKPAGSSAAPVGVGSGLLIRLGNSGECCATTQVTVPPCPPVVLPPTPKVDCPAASSASGMEFQLEPSKAENQMGSLFRNDEPTFPPRQWLLAP